VDSLAGFVGGNQSAFNGGLHALFQEAAGRWADLNSRLAGNKRIHAPVLSHTLTVARIGGSGLLLDRVWEVSDIVALLEASEQEAERAA
jgi:hypothetical protein